MHWSPSLLYWRAMPKGRPLPTHNKVLDASKVTFQLLGNTNAQISHMWRTEVITHITWGGVKLTSSYLDWSLPTTQRSWWTRSRPLDLQSRTSFLTRPPRARGLQPKTSKRPKLRERKLSVPTEPESWMDQVLQCHMYVNYLIMNYKSTLAHQIACMGVNDPPVDRSSSHRGALLPSHQWVNNYTGPLGNEYNKGLTDRLCVRATPVSSKPFTLLLKTNHSEGVNKTPSDWKGRTELVAVSCSKISRD